MKNLELELAGVQSLDTQEMKSVDGGFFPIIILGVALSSEAVAGLFFAGMGIGAAVAATN